MGNFWKSLVNVIDGGVVTGPVTEAVFNAAGAKVDNPLRQSLSPFTHQAYQRGIEAKQNQQMSNAQFAAEYPGLVNPNSGGSAADTEAALLKGQLENWQNQYVPVELNLLNQSSLNNPNVIPNAVKSAEQTAGNTADVMQSEQSRQLAARGIKPTGQQSTTMSRLSNLSRAGSVAGAANTARSNVATQDEIIALGTAPNPNVASQSLNKTPSQ